MAKRGRKPAWIGAALTSEIVKEFAARLDTIEAEEIEPAKALKADLKSEAKARNFPWGPFETARRIMDVSDDMGRVVQYVDQLNFCLEHMGLIREQLDIEHGAEVSVKAKAKRGTSPELIN